MLLAVVRAAVVWTTTSLAALAVPAWAVPGGGRPGPGTSFDRLVPYGAGLVLAACAVWVWCVTTAVLAEEALSWSRGRPVQARGVPAWARRAVLLACGLTLLGGPAHAMTAPAPAPVVGATATLAIGDPDRPVTTLPLPDRTTGPAHPRRAAPGGRGEPGLPSATVVVRPGDSLWSLAASCLPADAAPATVADAVVRLHLRNRAVVGADPDLIRPGQRLTLPPDLTREDHR